MFFYSEAEFLAYLAVASNGSGGGGAGTVTTVSVNTANGLGGAVANPTTAPAITLNTTVTGLLKGDGTGISAATAGTDYLGTSLSSGQILVGNASNAATPVSMSGNVTISNTGVATISNGAVTAAKIANSTITGAQIASNIALAGAPTTTTAPSNDNSTKVATTEFVTNAIAGLGNGTNLSATYTEHDVTINSSTGNGVTLNEATETEAGAMSAHSVLKLRFLNTVEVITAEDFVSGVYIVPTNAVDIRAKINTEGLTLVLPDFENLGGDDTSFFRNKSKIAITNDTASTFSLNITSPNSRTVNGRDGTVATYTLAPDVILELMWSDNNADPNNRTKPVEWVEI